MNRQHALVLVILPSLAACGDSVSGPQGESCGQPLCFSVLPVPESGSAVLSLFGGLNGPRNTLPTPHGVMFLARTDVTLPLARRHRPISNALPSWLVSMTSGSALRIEERDHAPGASPCNADRATWSFGPNVVSMVR